MSRYKPYPKYKESGVEWLGEVPEEWKPTYLKYIANIKMGQSPSSTTYNTDQKGIEFLQGNADFGKLYPLARIYTTDAKKISNENDILFTVRAPVGAINISDKKYAIGRGLCAISPTKHSRKEYLWYLMPMIKNELDSVSTGSTYDAVSAEQVSNSKVILPSKKEQTAIANFLDRETAKIDTLIGKQERLIELLQEKIIAVAMDEQINGAGKFERLRHLVDIIERPVKLNPQTEYTALGLYNRGRGLFHKPAKHGNEMGDSDFFYVESGDLILSGQFAWEGAVALAKDTENGCVVSHRYPVLRGKKLHTEYLLALFMTDFGNFLLNECSRGAAGRNRPLNTGLLLSEKIRIPSESTQNIIKKLVHKKFEIEQKANQAIKLLKERRTALISAAVTGKIQVNDEVREDALGYDVREAAV